MYSFVTTVLLLSICTNVARTKEALIYTVQQEMRCIDLEGVGQSAPVSNGTELPSPPGYSHQYVYALDHDPVDNLLYWSDIGHSTINRATLDGSGFEVVVSSIQSPGLVIDAVNRRIYWTNIQNRSIESSRFDGSDRGVVISSVGKPRDIDIDPDEGILYWTTEDGTVESSRVDGTDHKTISGVSISKYWPLLLDPKRDILYYNSLDGIYGANVGSNSNETVYGVSSERHTLGFSGNYLYWSEVCCSIKRMHRFDRTDAKNITELSTPAYSMVVRDFNKTADFCKASPCQNGGSCTNDVCNFVCQCPVPYYGLTCEIVDHCASSPCQNGASCVNGSTGYACQCLPGYLGDTCEQVDYCLPAPCQHGGSCINGPNEYICQCPMRYFGDNCEQESKVFALYPQFGPIAGGTELIIGGNYLSPGAYAILLGNDITFNITSSSSTQIRAITPEVSTFLRDQALQMTVLYPGNFRLETPFKFRYKANPTVISVSPLTTIPSGGVTLTVNGSFFDSVAKPQMNMTIIIKQDPENGSTLNVTHCRVHTPSVMHCVTPKLNIPKTISYDDIALYIGIILDGVPDYVNLKNNKELEDYSKVSVVSDPAFEKDQAFSYTGDPLHITGESVKVCCQTSEYKVYVGSAVGTVIDVIDDTVICHPPSETFATAVDGEYRIQVHVGTNLQYDVGTLTYVHTLPDWVIPLAVTASVAAMVAAVVLGVVLFAGKSKRNAVKEKQQLDSNVACVVDESDIVFPAVKMNDIGIDGLK